MLTQPNKIRARYSLSDIFPESVKIQRELRTRLLLLEKEGYGPRRQTAGGSRLRFALPCPTTLDLILSRPPFPQVQRGGPGSGNQIVPALTCLDLSPQVWGGGKQCSAPSGRDGLAENNSTN